jgi:hypothetical protein
VIFGPVRRTDRTSWERRPSQPERKIGSIKLQPLFSRFHENRVKILQFNEFAYRVVVHIVLYGRSEATITGCGEGAFL